MRRIRAKIPEKQKKRGRPRGTRFTSLNKVDIRSEYQTAALAIHLNLLPDELLLKIANGEKIGRCQPTAWQQVFAVGRLRRRPRWGEHGLGIKKKDLMQCLGKE